MATTGKYCLQTTNMVTPRDVFNPDWPNFKVLISKQYEIMFPTVCFVFGKNKVKATFCNELI